MDTGGGQRAFFSFAKTLEAAGEWPSVAGVAYQRRRAPVRGRNGGRRQGTASNLRWTPSTCWYKASLEGRAPPRLWAGHHRHANSSNGSGVVGDTAVGNLGLPLNPSGSPGEDEVSTWTLIHRFRNLRMKSAGRFPHFQQKEQCPPHLNERFEHFHVGRDRLCRGWAGVRGGQCVHHGDVEVQLALGLERDAKAQGRAAESLHNDPKFSPTD